MAVSRGKTRQVKTKGRLITFLIFSNPEEGGGSLAFTSIILTTGEEGVIKGENCGGLQLSACPCHCDRLRPGVGVNNIACLECTVTLRKRKIV
jgi:hypothetical protein